MNVWRLRLDSHLTCLVRFKGNLVCFSPPLWFVWEGVKAYLNSLRGTNKLTRIGVAPGVSVCFHVNPGAPLLRCESRADQAKDLKWTVLYSELWVNGDKANALGNNIESARR